MAEVPPTRMNQQIFKGKLKAAQGGHKLLKKKADALKVSWGVLYYRCKCHVLTHSYTQHPTRSNSETMPRALPKLKTAWLLTAAVLSLV